MALISHHLCATPTTPRSTPPPTVTPTVEFTKYDVSRSLGYIPYIDVWQLNYPRIVHTIAGVSMIAAVKNAHAQISMTPQFSAIFYE